jgi:hypothetical protein
MSGNTRRRWITAVLLGCSAFPAMAAGLGKTDLGRNVLVFSPSMPAAVIQRRIDEIYSIQRANEFGSERNALLFLPGEYKVDIPVGFYTEVVGLGASPDDVRITGNVHADASAPHNNATTTFWRAAEGFSISPAGGRMQWAVSQAVSFRRMHVRGDIVLHQHGGWASGGWMSDDLIDGKVDAGPQQQWISRNTEWGSWSGSNWNMVFLGIPNPPPGEWPVPPYTKIAETPVIREKPFLQADAAGDLSVCIPSLRRRSVGITWHSGTTPGKSIPISRFYIAQPEKDSAATLNAKLAKGQNLLLTPGVYRLTEALRISRPNTVVLGLGFATLKPINGTAAMTTEDVDGIIVAGLLFDAGEKQSPVLLQVGPDGSKARHRENPISLHDIFFRVGGAGAGRTVVNLKINSSDTIVDDTWIWRADHGSGVGWLSNTSDNGLIVNGDDVTAYGLFVEHHQQFQVLWNGNHGRTYFYQSEIPYDPPDQARYTSAPGTNGWASYKVSDKVTDHEAWGLGIYSVFLHPGIVLTRAIEVPKRPEVKFHHMITVALGDYGEISHVINDTGEATSIHPRVTPKVTDYP